MNPLMEVEN